MFVVTDVRHPFLFWASVELRAETGMSLRAEHLRLDALGAPELESRGITVEAGETFTISARRSDGYRVGDRMTLEQVASKLPISLKWQVVAAS